MGKNAKTVLFLILLLGTSLRVWGINFGLPYQFHQDEPIVVNHALAYGTGDLNPHFFIVPPLTSYILFFFYAAYYLLLNVLGIVKGSEQFASMFFKDPTAFYIIGRMVIGVLPSIASIYLVFRLAGKFFSRQASLYSALAMALVFLNVINAHYIYTDSLLVMFLLLAYLAMADLLKSPSLKNYILSGVCIGLAAATKYNAILLAVPFLLLHIFVGRKRLLDIKMLLGICAIAMAFIAFNPYSVLDWKFFLSSITGGIWHTYTGWIHHITYSLFEGIGPLLTVLGAIGLVLILMRSIYAGVLLLSFPAVFYMHLIFCSQPFSRYVLPLVPFLTIGAGFLFYDYLYSKYRLPAARVVIITLSIATLVPTFTKSVKADILFAGKDTRAEAAEWIRSNLPGHAKIALDHTFFAPQLKQTKEQLEAKESIVNNQPELSALKSKKLGLQISALNGEKTYETYYVVGEGEGAGKFLVFWPVIRSDMNALKDKNVEYVVVNNMIASDSMRRFRREILELYIPIAEFSPYKKSAFRESYDKIETTCIPVTYKELFSRKNFGPYIIIYGKK